MEKKRMIGFIGHVDLMGRTISHLLSHKTIEVNQVLTVINEPDPKKDMSIMLTRTRPVDLIYPLQKKREALIKLSQRRKEKSNTMKKETEEEQSTPIEKVIKEFERLKEKAPSIRDMVYLDGVLAVLDSHKEYEKKYFAEKLKLSIPSEDQIKDRYPERSDSGKMLEYNLARREGAKWIIELLTKG